jgi:hypothetical protein
MPVKNPYSCPLTVFAFVSMLNKLLGVLYPIFTTSLVKKELPQGLHLVTPWEMLSSFKLKPIAISKTHNKN